MNEYNEDHREPHENLELRKVRALELIKSTLLVGIMPALWILVGIMAAK